MSVARRLAALALATVACLTSPRGAAGQGAAGDTARAAAAAQTSAAAMAPGADSALDARTAAVSSQLRCPVCQGLSIQDSPSDLAQDMRAVVRDQLASGQTSDQVKAYFVSKYGEWILLSPRPKGFNVLAYALPIGEVLLGLLVIVIAVRRWTRPPDAGAQGAPGS